MEEMVGTILWTNVLGYVSLLLSFFFFFSFLQMALPEKGPLMKVRHDLLYYDARPICYDQLCHV